LTQISAWRGAEPQRQKVTAPSPPLWGRRRPAGAPGRYCGRQSVGEFRLMDPLPRPDGVAG